MWRRPATDCTPADARCALGAVQDVDTVLVVDELDLTVRIEAACALIARGQIDGLEGLSALAEVDGGAHSRLELTTALARRLKELR